jgi:Tol biopolymer transport system component
LGRLAQLLALLVLVGCGGSSADSTVGEIAYAVQKLNPGERITVVRDDGTGRRRVAAADRRTNADHPVWSPDGTKIAFTRWPPEFFTPSHVYVVNADGTGERRLGPGVASLWTIDGTALLVERRSGIYSLNVDRTGGRRVAKGTGPALSHDGSKLVFLRYTAARASDGGCCITGTSALFTVPLQGGPPRRLASTSGGDEGYHFFAPEWLAGDREIGVLMGNEYSGDTSLGTVSEDGRQRVIAEGVGDDFAWSPEGDRVAYSGESSVLYVARGDGAEPRAFSLEAVASDSPSSIRWSPDGEKIAFCVGAPDSERVQDVYVLDVDDGARRRIARVPGLGVDLAWRPATS